ncbi:pyocin knob domain-containing protein [Atlantibacter hermannii]|uniref:pyocin knob domain-containing protein n=1 Tax=Atlantibacter hermannii TaxID=565 RepID=UPI001FD0CF43|nr:pyocin knob domain-containing protein [Atlantibacter hermannii]
MSAGTLKLTNNSTAVVGTSTLFTTDLKPGDFITATIGGVLYTLPVDTVTSNTAATLVSPFTGPTTTGAAWAAVPRKVLSQVTADLVAQTTAAMRGMNNDKANWQSFYSAAGDINITLPDGTKVPGPSWTKMAGLVSSSQQWRGNLPAAANLNAYGPTPDFTGTWNRSSNTNTTAAYAFPEDNGQGILEVFAGGRYGGLQRYTVSTSGNVYIRSLTGAWNGTDGPWSGWLPAGVKPLNDLGMGWSAITTLSSFDWQQFDALSGQICRVAIENMSNLPPGITFTNGTGVYVLVNGTSSGGARFSLEVIPDTATDPNYKIYKVLVVGAKGARTFSVRQVFTNTDVVPVANGGTGATTPAGGRTALELGTAAIRNTGTAAGTIPVLGTTKIPGSLLLSLASSNTPGIAYSGNRTAAIAAALNIGNNANNAASAVVEFERGGQYGCFIGLDTDNKFKIGGWSMGNVAYEFYHQGNTVVDGNGYLKKASPVIKVAGDGSAELNAESAGVKVERISTGVYRVSGVMGFNSDPAWGGIDGGIEVPTDKNKLPLVWVDYEVESDGSILLKTFHRTHVAAPPFARNEIDGVNDGDPVDIPAGRCVDLRVEMPVNSIWNTEQARLAEEFRAEYERQRQEAEQQENVEDSQNQSVTADKEIDSQTRY